MLFFSLKKNLCIRADWSDRSQRDHCHIQSTLRIQIFKLFCFRKSDRIFYPIKVLALPKTFWIILRYQANNFLHQIKVSALPKSFKLDWNAKPKVSSQTRNRQPKFQRPSWQFRLWFFQKLLRLPLTDFTWQSSFVRVVPILVPTLVTFHF